MAVSFDRPYGKYAQIYEHPLSLGSGEYLLWEFPLAYWLEQHGYDVTYCSNADMITPDHGLKCKAFISIGPLLVGPGEEPALDRAAQAFQGGRGDDTLRRPSDPHQQVDPRLRAGGHDRAGDVAVGDEPDPGSGLAELLDQAVVAWPVEDHHRHVGEGDQENEAARPADDGGARQSWCGERPSHTAR